MRFNFTTQVLGTIDDMVTVPSTTKVLDQVSLDSLSAVTTDGIMTFDTVTTELNSLSHGDVIVCGVSDNTPYGLLRKVVSVIQSGNQIIITTTQATLEDAFEKVSIHISKELTPAGVSSVVTNRGVSLTSVQKTGLHTAEIFELGSFNYDLDAILFDVDGNEETTHDQIVATGNISFDAQFEFDLELDWFTLQQLMFKDVIKEKANLQMSTNIPALSIQEEREIARIYFTPIPISVIIITPVLTVNVGVDGSLSIGVTAEITQEASLEAGLQYERGIGWSPISNFENDFQYDPPILSADVDVKGYAGPQLSLLLYGITGPYGEVNGYLKFEGDFYYQLFNSDYLLLWILYGGLEVNVGVKVEVISFKIADYEHLGVIDEYWPLLQTDTDGDEIPDDGDNSKKIDDYPCTGGLIENCDDNCPDVSNPDQTDSDGDGIGDACDDDADGDGYEGDLGTGEDCDDLNADINPGATEICSDGIDQDCDGYDQVCSVDTDGDGIPDDGDNSGIAGDDPCAGGETQNCDDNCPNVSNPDQADSDGDGIGNACDTVDCEEPGYPDTMVGSISVGSGPIGIAVIPDGSRIYISNWGDNSMSVIQTSDNSVMETIPVGNQPAEVAVTPDGSYVYVANAVSKTLSAIRTSDNLVIQTTALLFDPNAVGITPNGCYVYVSSHGGDSVSVVQTSDNSVLKYISVGDGPSGYMGFMPDSSRVYVPLANGYTVSVIE